MNSLFDICYGSKQMIHEKHARFSLGDEILDSYFDGGLPAVPICEISGESATGKTQLCFQIITSNFIANLANNNNNSSTETGNVVYVSTEGGGSQIRRLNDMIKNQMRNKMLLSSTNVAAVAAGNSESDYVDTNELLSNVIIENIDTIDEFWDFLSKRLRVLLIGYQQDKHVKLVIVDSITALFRGNEENLELRHRTEIFFIIAAEMKRIFDEYGCRFLIINQVSGSGSEMKPSLGLSWSSSINARFMLSHCQSLVDDDNKFDEENDLFTSPGKIRILPPRRRKITTSFSPSNRDTGECIYEIRPQGLIGLEFSR